MPKTIFNQSLSATLCTGPARSLRILPAFVLACFTLPHAGWSQAVPYHQISEPVETQGSISNTDNGFGTLVPGTPGPLALSPRESAYTPAPDGSGDFSGFLLTAGLTPALLPAIPETAVSSSASPVFGPQQTPAQAAPGAPHSSPDQPSKRILGIVPNYRAVGVGVKLPPQSVQEKFVTASEDTFDYSALALAVLVAGYSDASAATPEFGSGGVAFGRYLWHSFVDQSIENYSVEFVVPTLTHEDTRYYTLGSGGFNKRTVYALTRLLVTRSDSGHETVNLSELLGAGLGAGVSNFYYPRPERTAGKTLGKYATNLGIDAASYFIREFDSEISRTLTPRHKAATADAAAGSAKEE